MRSIVSAVLLTGLLIGCSQPSSPTAKDFDVPELTTLTSAEVTQLAKSVDQPVIVEFSVLHGCDRCGKMRPEVRQLAAEQASQISIVRADFIKNQPLLQSLGATVCPTYVLFTPEAPPQLHASPELLISRAAAATIARDDESF